MYHPVTHGISIEKKTSERENILVILEEFFEMVERWVGSLTVPLNSVILLIRSISPESMCRTIEQRGNNGSNTPMMMD